MTLTGYIHQLAGLEKELESLARQDVNRIADRHLARCKQNTAVGDSPDSPTLRNRWDRSGVHKAAGGIEAEVFNPVDYASHYEFGHRQTPGRVIFIELRSGGQKYGIKARQVKSGPNAGKWGIYLRLKQPYVKGAFIMTGSEKKAQAELDAAALRMDERIRRRLK